MKKTFLILTLSASALPAIRVQSAPEIIQQAAKVSDIDLSPVDGPSGEQPSKVSAGPDCSEAEKKAGEAAAELHALRVKLANGEKVSDSTIVLAHEKAMLARFAANREYMRSLIESRDREPEMRELRQALVEAPSAEARRAILTRHFAITQVLERGRDQKTSTQR